jgi:hypothetical protein
LKILKRFSPKHFWTSESGLTSLLIVLNVFLMLNMVGDFRFGFVLTRLFFFLVLIAGILTTFSMPVIRFLCISLAMVSLPLSWVADVWPNRSLAALDAGLVFIYLGILLAVVSVQVFRSGPVTAHRICGAVAVYFLLGVMWALLYQLLLLLDPGAFQFPGSIATNQPLVIQKTLTYFSFVTLTTVGYGDITPVHPAAKLLVMYEALIGQLYPAIILARLVSLQLVPPKEGD